MVIFISLQSQPPKPTKMTISSAVEPLKILIHSMDGTGHLNACIGIGQALAQRSHQVIFVINEAFRKETEKFGFQVIGLKEAKKPNQENPVKSAGKSLLSSPLLSNASSFEKMQALVKGDISKHLYEKTYQFSSQIGDAIQQESPDLIVIDNILIAPQIVQSHIPYVVIFSGNPLSFYNSPKLPPIFSGYSTSSDPSSWTEFNNLMQNKFLKSHSDNQVKLNEAFNLKSNGHQENHQEENHGMSPYLNIYAFPLELDYQDLVPLPKNIIQIDAFCREIAEPFELDGKFQVQPNEKLIYLSMGSMGCYDVELMKRLTKLIGTTAHKCIVSKGPRADEYELPDNCWGEAHLPQTRILPLVDLVITHGGNNIVTETFMFGKPMIVLPLFADQYDNAQRIQEKGFGIRLETYEFEDDELIEAIDRLLNDEQLNSKLKIAAKRIEESNSKEKACVQMEKLVSQI